MPGKEIPAKGAPCGPKIMARYVFAILGSIGLGIVYGLKVNLHVAIVSMVNHTAIMHKGDIRNLNSSDNALEDPCGFGDTGSQQAEDGPFNWSGTIQGTLLSAYFWGYIVAQIPGGRVAELFSAKWVMFFSVAINVICTLLSPLFAKIHYGALLVLRIGEGIGGGVTFPAMHVMLAHWAPPSERSVMSSIIYSGTALGTVISMLVSGVIAGGLGWEAVFYIEGGVCCIWMAIWVWIISDSPQQQKYISEEERNFIVSALNNEGVDDNKRHPKMPWKAALTSAPFLAILIAHTCSNWGWYMVLIELPLYMKNVLNYKISENAVLTAVPFLCMWLFSIVLSKVLDVLRTKKIISTTIARKIATSIASVVPIICFIVLCYISVCERVAAVAMMTIAIMSIGGMFCGFLSNHIDIAPNYAGTLMAVTNTVATIPGIVVPIFVGKLTHEDPSIHSWRIIFWVTIALYVIEVVVYGIFASGEVQKWNYPDGAAVGEEQPLKSQQSPKLDK